ncbi:AP-1 transcriptional activator, putative? [Candida dubliniensis CD36]|uniref:AP-1 transcriptional activator, putative n=1 Tax=Candida dubliniensis (strain CD36 / ATCC MYA-646 / CBS 7987 / NCPF 3949 / NRRL Y-17841) TaxID=573826 RepID=B9W9C4_CANDC|nr:AP-1 transcriptional activator, putative? [Candida dubliniensis CD36]CAX45406.1 AP-1 transcriptional activator, putative? [Candida dubliniensis CD36]
MPAKGPNIIPKQAPSPIAIAGSPPSSSASTPRSAASPPVSVNTKSSNNNTIVPRQVMSIQTSKEWVLPPRPKPGRKPSVDTPASKRKAQNRAAQRAFRERRATRVQELEQKLMEVEKERDIKEMALVNTINKLKVENQFLVKNLEQLKGEMNQIKQSYSRSQQQLISKPSPAEAAAGAQQIKPSFSFASNSASSNHPSPSHHNSISPTGSSYSVQQISPAPSTDSPPNSYNINNDSYRQFQSTLTPIPSNNTPDKPISATDVANFDCGVCPKEECLCESVGLKEPTKDKAEDAKKQLQNQINSFKPMPAVSLSRKRKIKSTDEEQEIDFTKQFSSRTKPMPDLKKLKKTTLSHETETETASTFNEDSPVDNCGFCSDDTPCVCREAAKEAAKLNEYLNNPHQSSIIEEEISEQAKTLPPLQTNNSNHNFSKSALPVMHPGPTVEIREFTNINTVPNVLPASKNENEPDSSGKDSSSDSGCTGNPGTCRQCQMDPMSTLFCTTVASRSTKTGSVSSTRQSISRTNSKTSISIDSLNNPQSPIPPPLLANNKTNSGGSSAATPTPTTPSHSSSVSSNSGIFIPCSDAYKTLSRHKKFNSVDFTTLVGKLTTRGMQVEVQSVANVLRELDRRLYN